MPERTDSPYQKRIDGHLAIRTSEAERDAVNQLEQRLMTAVTRLYDDVSDETAKHLIGLLRQSFIRATASGDWLPTEHVEALIHLLDHHGYHLDMRFDDIHTDDIWLTLYAERVNSEQLAPHTARHAGIKTDLWGVALQELASERQTHDTERTDDTTYRALRDCLRQLDVRQNVRPLSARLEGIDTRQPFHHIARTIETLGWYIRRETHTTRRHTTTCVSLYERIGCASSLAMTT